jgi:coiled-coil domain-containing protein 130
MAERKATNKYYPPDWDPSKGSINKFVRNKKSSGIIPTQSKKNPGKTVRFETPFDAWCTSCNTFITKATRYNANKTSDGFYFTTPIFRFTMNCGFCKCKMVIRNDPKNRTYEMLENIRMKEETYSFEEDDNAPKLLTEEEREHLNDPLFRLEYGKDDEVKAEKELLPVLDNLKEIKDEQSKNDYELNKLLREKMRKERKRTMGDQLKYGALGGLNLQKSSKEDLKVVEKMIFNPISAVSKQHQIRNSSIFGKKQTTNQKLKESILKNKK